LRSDGATRGSARSMCTGGASSMRSRCCSSFCSRLRAIASPIARSSCASRAARERCASDSNHVPTRSASASHEKSKYRLAPSAIATSSSTVAPVKPSTSCSPLAISPPSTPPGDPGSAIGSVYSRSASRPVQPASSTAKPIPCSQSGSP
jgi:hypothetical protein